MNDPVAIHYFQQVSCDKNKQLFHTPWGGCVLKNCDSSGNLLEFISISDYEKHMKSYKTELWIHLKLKIFKVKGSDDSLFGVFICSECMSSMVGLEVNQAPEDIKAKQCLHSLVSSCIIGDWRQFWEPTTSINDGSSNVLCKDDDKFATFIPQSSDTSLLAAVRDEKNISLLYCSTARQEVPFCTSCVVRKCKHYRQLLHFNTQAQENVEGNETDNDDFDYNAEEEEEQEEFGPKDHYKIPLKRHTHGLAYGYNFSKIMYPFKDDGDLQSVWRERRNGIYDLPRDLIPSFSDQYRCKHGQLFNKCDESLVRESHNVIIYTDTGERFFPNPVLARPTVGPCLCLQRVDGHLLLLWHLGKGRFVDYTMLHGYLHKWTASGISIQAMYKSNVSGAESCGLSSSLTYSDLHRAVCGFFCNLVFDDAKAFSCPKHGTSPKFIVSDGKALGPLKSRCKHLKELDIAKDDHKVLTQSTHHKDRVFMNVKKERAAVIKLLTNDSSLEDFETAGEMTTDNGILVLNLIRYLRAKYEEKIPSPYAEFLGNISKNCSARSLVQTCDVSSLDYLGDYCREELDLQILQHEEKIKLVIKSFPAIWPTLDAICSLEKCKYPPRQVSRILLTILKITRNTFEEATKRSNSDYYLWTDSIQEHPTQCYPTLPLWRHPSRYQVSAQIDADLCDKSFNYHNDFVAGFYSVGCACEFNITYGFELMILKESPRNLFRFLMTRDVDIDALEGILVDHGCIFEPYVMNREAKLLEKKLVFVDGAHWQGMKKMKKFDKSGKGGHVGYVKKKAVSIFLIIIFFSCSDGFNFNIFKKSLGQNINSQGREQMHSLIKKIAQSLRLMSYRHYMIFMYVFFAVTNLQARK